MKFFVIFLIFQYIKRNLNLFLDLEKNFIMVKINYNNLVSWYYLQDAKKLKKIGFKKFFFLPFLKIAALKYNQIKNILSKIFTEKCKI